MIVVIGIAMVEFGDHAGETRLYAYYYGRLTRYLSPISQLTN